MFPLRDVHKMKTNCEQQKVLTAAVNCCVTALAPSNLSDGVVLLYCSVNGIQERMPCCFTLFELSSAQLCGCALFAVDVMCTAAGLWLTALTSATVCGQHAACSR